MAQLSCETPAIEYQRCAFILGQIALHLVKLAVRYADGCRDMALIVFGAFGAGIDNNHWGTFIDLVFYITCFNTDIRSRSLFPCWKTIGKYLYIFIAKFFCLPGRFMT